MLAAMIPHAAGSRLQASQPVGDLLGSGELLLTGTLVAATGSTSLASRALAGPGATLAGAARGGLARPLGGGALRPEHLGHVLLEGVHLVGDVDGAVVVVDVDLVDVDHPDEPVHQGRTGTGSHELGSGGHADDGRLERLAPLLLGLLHELVDAALRGL